MNDPFGRNSQELTDLLLQLDRAISIAESNVAAAQQLGLPEAAGLAMQLPALTYSARAFLANVPDMTQPQRWGESRRLMEQARAFQPRFAPYLMLGNRVAAARQAIADHEARTRAMAEAARRARDERHAQVSLDEARRRFSQVRQTLADMQLQRGPGFDDPEWQESIRSVSSILTAQDVRMAGAAASMRDGAFDQAQAQLDQTLGELQAALDLAQRARVAAGMRAQAQRMAQPSPAAQTTMRMPDLRQEMTTPPILKPPASPATPPSAMPTAAPPPATPAPVPTTVVSAAVPAPAPQASVARVLSLIESRTGTVFRCDGRPTVVGRGLDRPVPEITAYIDLSRGCDPGEAEYLGISRRHAEIARQQVGFVLRDLGSTNGTRLRHAGQSAWETLVPQQWAALREGDTLQFGLLECTVSLT